MTDHDTPREQPDDWHVRFAAENRRRIIARGGDPDAEFAAADRLDAAQEKCYAEIAFHYSRRIESGVEHLREAVQQDRYEFRSASRLPTLRADAENIKLYAERLLQHLADIEAATNPDQVEQAAGIEVGEL